jgi:hypothetical protein
VSTAVTLRGPDPDDPEGRQDDPGGDHSVGAWRPVGKQSLVLIGDGGFQMVGQAVSTMVRRQHDVIVVIIDNSLYGTTNSNEDLLRTTSIIRGNTAPHKRCRSNQYNCGHRFGDRSREQHGHRHRL